MDCRQTKVKAKTPVKRTLQCSREAMVIEIEVEKRGQICNIVKSKVELADDLDKIAERKESRKTPEHAAEHVVDCCNISQDREDMGKRDRFGGGVEYRVHCHLNELSMDVI